MKLPLHGETDAAEAVILDDGLQAFPIPAVKLNAPITLKESWNRLRRRGDGNCLFYSLLGRDHALAAAQLRVTMRVNYGWQSG